MEKKFLSLEKFYTNIVTGVSDYYQVWPPYINRNQPPLNINHNQALILFQEPPAGQFQPTPSGCICGGRKAEARRWQRRGWEASCEEGGGQRHHFPVCIYKKNSERWRNLRKSEKKKKSWQVDATPSLSCFEFQRWCEKEKLNSPLSFSSSSVFKALKILRRKMTQGCFLYLLSYLFLAKI